MYPAGAPPKADAWTLDAFLKAAEACHKAGFPFGIGLGSTDGLRRYRRRHLPGVRRASGRRQGQHHGQVRHGAPGARILQEARPVPAAGCAGLGRRLQQQVAGGRQGRADHEPAERLGGRQARRAADRRAVWTHGMPSGPNGRFAPFLPYFWGIWNFSKNKPAAKSLLRAPVAARGDREDGGGQRGLRPAVVREADDAQDLGRGRAAEGHALPLPQPAQPPDPVGRRRSRRRPRSPCRSTRRRSRPRWWCASCRARPMERTLAWAESEVEGFMRT